MPSAAIRMDQEIILLSEVSQIEKNKFRYCLYVESLKIKMNKKTNLWVIKGEKRGEG